MTKRAHIIGAYTNSRADRENLEKLKERLYKLHLLGVDKVRYRLALPYSNRHLSIENLKN